MRTAAKVKQSDKVLKIAKEASSLSASEVQFLVDEFLELLENYEQQPQLAANAKVLEGRLTDVGDAGKWVELNPDTDEDYCRSRNAKWRRERGYPESGPINFGGIK
ncbi:hypothetical protein FACS1894125_3730 [Actinomycetota bacterium]|nr:hypothetical protein FACS1894125_3730 [Actinomycetota bacterium]